MLAGLKEIGWDSVFYIVINKSIEFYTENPRLSGWNLATPTPLKGATCSPLERENLA